MNQLSMESINITYIENELKNIDIDNLYFLLINKANKANKDYKNIERRTILKTSPLSGKQNISYTDNKIKSFHSYDKIDICRIPYTRRIPYELKYRLLNNIMLKKYCNLIISIYSKFHNYLDINK